jgi:hypothetical protein
MHSPVARRRSWVEIYKERRRERVRKQEEKGVARYEGGKK